MRRSCTFASRLSLRNSSSLIRHGDLLLLLDSSVACCCLLSDHLSLLHLRSVADGRRNACSGESSSLRLLLSEELGLSSFEIRI